MTSLRRINVDSGRPLEALAHYSRALRAGDTVLQSGTTAIDRQGNVRGEGDVAAQVDAIMRIAEWSMGQAGGPQCHEIGDLHATSGVHLHLRHAHLHAR